MLKQIGITGHNIFTFLDDGWLFDYIEEINMKLKAYKEEAFVDELFSNPKEIIILLKLDYFHELTPEYIESVIHEFKEYYECVVNKIMDNHF
ncbi:hypothetical protein [Methanobacterium sp.]|uniref:hypothetical protein n=1 Tax=Methanobacterium sp. TaxID=2164 RepID=UPI003C784F67